MSERGVGTAEREALDRLHARMVSIRCEQYRLLEDVAELERLGVAVSTGNRTTERLLQDSLRIDLKDARRLVGESEDLTPQQSVRGEPLPVRMPNTARVMAEGLVDDALEIIRKAMARLAKAENVDPWDVVDAERSSRTRRRGCRRARWRRSRSGCSIISIRTGRRRRKVPTGGTSCT